jgi:hypothetical protein
MPRSLVHDDAVRLCPGTAATIGPLVYPHMIYEYETQVEFDREKQITRGETYPSATLPTTNHTRTDNGAHPGVERPRPVTKRPSHGTAHLQEI